MCDIRFMVEYLLKTKRPPAIVLIHVGTNDLIKIDEYGLRQQVSVLLRDLEWQFPESVLIWSDILPRVHYKGARSQSAVERKRRTINQHATF